jgi:hypothetical protein
MLRMGIVTAGAIVPAFVILSGVAGGSATAQTATNETSSKPIQLLRILQQAEPQAKAAAKPGVKGRIAYRKKPRSHATVVAQGRHLYRPPLAQTTATKSATPAAPSAAPAEATTLAAATPPLASVPRDAARPSEVVVGGQTTQLASSDAGDTIELSANNENVQLNRTPPTVAAASAIPMRDVTGVAPKSDFANVKPDLANVKSDFVKSDLASVSVAQQQGSEAGSLSWILQTLAALAGAVAAGSVAWFLIGSTPVSGLRLT